MQSGEKKKFTLLQTMIWDCVLWPVVLPLLYFLSANDSFLFFVFERSALAILSTFYSVEQTAHRIKTSGFSPKQKNSVEKSVIGFHSKYKSKKIHYNALNGQVKIIFKLVRVISRMHRFCLFLNFLMFL